MEEKNVSLEEATTESTVKEEETVEVANESTTTKLVDDANNPKEEKGKFKRGYEKLILSLNGMAYGLFATLIIGTNDGSINTSTPTIIGKNYGVVNTGTFNFYDGTMKGMTAAMSGSITNQETNSQIANGVETIDGNNYKTQYLEPTS